MKHYPQYTNNEKNIHIKKYSETKSRGQTPNPDIEALPPANSSVTNEDKKIRRLDINDLLAAIMVRMRKNNEASFHRKSSSPTQETSFYYKESSVYSSTSKEENSAQLMTSSEDNTVKYTIKPLCKKLNHQSRYSYPLIGGGDYSRLRTHF